MTFVLIDILKEPNSYCLRERVSRESELIKSFLAHDVETKQFKVGIKLVCIFLKYNQSYLTLSHNFPIVEQLRKKWNLLATYNID